MIQFIQGGCREALKTLPDASVQCCVTSPPYFGLRDYKVDGQIGREPTPSEYVMALVGVFAEIRRVLKMDATVWLNLGDSYASSAGGYANGVTSSKISVRSQSAAIAHSKWRRLPAGLKPKDLFGIPWMVAFALREQGWWLRSDIVWAKPNGLPESVTDRPTRSHEYIFLLTKSERYYYDADAIKEPCIYDVDGTQTLARKARTEEGQKGFPIKLGNGPRPPAGFKDATKMGGKHSDKQRGHSRRHRWDRMSQAEQCTGMRNKRDVWTVAPAQFQEAHFATFPPDLIRPCILAGSRPGDIVLDPFAGAFTTCVVAEEYGRNSIGIELNPDYIEIGKRRCAAATPGLGI